MNVLTAIGDLSLLTGPVHLAIGVFDGVHRGHQAVIASALAQPGTAVVVTFDPHPALILRPERRPRMLTSTRHKAEILRGLGVENLLVIPFDDGFAATRADDFVRQLEAACRPLGSVAVGSDWTFGHRAAGNVALLRSLGITVHAVEPVLVDGVVARSTAVRDAVAAGDLARAERLLARPYTVVGRVVEGRRLGHELGFPTANLSLESELLPPHGVYAARVRRGTDWLAGVANLGLRPTVESGAVAPRLEVHLFDFAGDLYGEDLEVEFVAGLRGEETFPSLDALRDQIARDGVAARQVLSR